jgi:hypothetical protein
MYSSSHASASLAKRTQAVAQEDCHRVALVSETSSPGDSVMTSVACPPTTLENQDPPRSERSHLPMSPLVAWSPTSPECPRLTSQP